MESQRFFFHSKNNRKSVRPVWRLRVNCRSSLFDSHLLVRSDTIGDTKRTSCCREVAMFFDVTVKTSMRCFFLPFGSMLKHGQHYLYCVRCQIDSLQETNDFWIFGKKIDFGIFFGCSKQWNQRNSSSFISDEPSKMSFRKKRILPFDEQFV